MTKRLTLLAAIGVPAVLYVYYVAHYAVDVPYGDDWNVVRLVVSSLHRNVQAGDLWTQYGDTRLFIPELVFVLFGRLNDYDIRSILVFGALTFAAGYLVLLIPLRRYLGKLTPLPVIVVAIVWFSLADVQNALWAFQLAWYIATFFFVAMVALLLEPHHRVVMFGLALVAAVAGSYTIVQGFVLWPIGVICICWPGWRRQTYIELAVWLSTAFVAAAIYLHGFVTNSTTDSALTHPHLVIRYVVLLMGNVIPTSLYTPNPNFVVHELLGVVVAIGAVLVIVGSIRERHTHSPLPLILISYGLLFDLMIAVGRFGAGLDGALNNNRYTMPNIVLLVGIVVYGCNHLPSPDRHDLRRTIAFSLGVGAVAVAFVATTTFGITNARRTRAAHITAARVVVNFDLIPTRDQGCAAAYAVYAPHDPWQARNVVATFGRAFLATDHLSLFQPDTYARHRAAGPPSTEEINAAGDFAGVRAYMTDQCFFTP